MPQGLLPEHQATAPVVENNEIVNKPEAEEPKRDVAEIAAQLQAQADAEAAANKAANEKPNLTEEEAEEIGKKHVEKALAKKDGDEGTDKKVTAGDDWTPNFKYKVLDQEKEIPEWARGAITKENEAEIRQLFEKADGIEHVKAQREEERGTRESLEHNFSVVKNEINQLVGWRDKNLGIFFDKVGLPKQKVAQWLLHEIEKQEMPESVRQMYTEHEEHQRRLADLEAENFRLTNGRDTDMVQARTNELGQVLSNPEVASLVSAFDSRVGKPGSFMQMVVRHGNAEWEASGHKRDLTPKEAVDEVLKILNLSQAAGPAVTPNETRTPVASESKQKVVQRTKPVVLPSIGNGGSAPSAKRVKSVADIRKVYKEMSGQN